MTKLELIEKINSCKKIIGEQRDILRDLIDEASMLCENSEEAVNSLTDAVDTLSELL